MNGENLRVLLIGEGSGSFSGIIRRLEKSGCLCRFTNSYEEARRLVGEEGFDLVLSVIPPREKAMSLLTMALAGTHANVFYAHPVEDSCWWLPMLRDGSQCFGKPALRPSEFASLLNRVVEEIQGRPGTDLRPGTAKLLPQHAESPGRPQQPAKVHPVRAA